jgi:acyl dehydratase
MSATEKRGTRLGQGVLWDDLAVGAWFHTAGRTITEADLSSFTNLTWLTEELFTNAAEREDMAIKGRVVPGALVYAFGEGLLGPFMQGTGLAFLEAGFKVHGPTVVGDTIRLECEVSELRPTSKPDRGLVRTTNHVVNQRGETVVTYTPLRLLRRRQAAA